LRVEEVFNKTVTALNSAVTVQHQDYREKRTDN
jgi:hypothetical protein